MKWQVQFRIDGKLTGETFDTPEAAHRFGNLVDTIGGKAARQVLAARQGRNEKVVTLREFTERYLDPDSGLLTGVTDGTRHDYRLAAERSFLMVLGEMPVDAITKQDIGRWVAWQEKQPSTRGGKDTGKLVAPKTVTNYHGLLSSVMNTAVEAKLIPDNPARGTRLSKGRRPEIVFLTPDEYMTLLHFIPDRHKPFVQFLAGTGCRWGEATAVTWGDINLRVHPATVRIDKAYKKGVKGKPVLGDPKSFKGTRTIALSDDTVAMLGNPGSPDQLLFPGRVSGRNQLWKVFQKSTWEPAVRKAMDPELCKAAGLEPLTKRPTIHGLRHSHASWLIANGVPLFLIAARLGHENTDQISKTYGHLMPDAHLVMADVVQTAMAGTHQRQIAS
ncbi:tyrosine-type recombinase/integrase [Microbacterium sp. F51-2R]|uniref:tyrosine-type recombinase/integrase n=1 Tax=Microbacterium sp. F51-2R TaxID=3445777 RepID=UPI003FA0AEE7